MLQLRGHNNTATLVMRTTWSVIGWRIVIDLMNYFGNDLHILFSRIHDNGKILLGKDLCHIHIDHHRYHQCHGKHHTDIKQIGNNT